MAAPAMGNAPPRGYSSPTPLQWLDLLFLLLFNVVSGVAFTLIVTGLAMFAFRISFAVLQESTGIAASVVIIAQALLSGATLAFLYVLVRGRTSAPFWPAVGWHAFANAASRAAVAARYMLSGFALALVVGILGRFVGTPSSPVPFEQLLRSRPSVLLLMGLGILVAPFVEETVFRGCIYPVIAGRFGVAAGVIVTGAVFGLVHAAQLGFMWGQVSLLVLVGIVFTYIRARAGTVAASYFVHLGYNTTLFTLFYWATGGLRRLPGS
jgi:membrane protease YdiL (CAAX protease family)